MKKFYISILILTALLVLLPGCVSTESKTGGEKTLYSLEKKLSSPVVTIPEVKKEVLPNGLRVILMQRKDLPVVQALMTFVHGGSSFDPEQLAGLSNITALLLNRGTATKDAPAIADELDFMAADISASGDRDTSSVVLKCMSKYTDAGFALFADIIMRPVFDDDEIARMKQQIYSSILADRDKHDVYASKMLSEYIYGKHPYHRPDEGYENTLPAIARKDIVDFHRAHYVPDDAILVIVGDFETGAMSALVSKAFGAWKKGSTVFPVIPPVEPLRGKKVIILDRDVTQTTVCFGHIGLKRLTPDFYPVLLLNQILGGSDLSARINRKVRTEMGLAYSVGTWFVSRRESGSFLAFTQTKNENAHLAVRAMFDEIKKIRTEKVSPDELHAAKSFYNGGFPLRFETNADFAYTLFFTEMYDMGLSYFRDYLDAVNAVSQVDVLSAAQKYLDPENYVLVAVTKAGFADNFREFGDVEIIRE